MAKRKKTIDDPVLEKLTFDYLWGAKVPMGPLGEIEVLVDAGVDDSLPSDEQRTAVVQMQHRIPLSMDSLYEAIFSYYCDNRVEPDAETPQLSSVKEIHKVLRSSPTLVVEAAHEGETPEVKLDWSFTFDLEHCLSIRLIDGVIQDVGIK